MSKRELMRLIFGAAFICNTGLHFLFADDPQWVALLDGMLSGYLLRCAMESPTD